MNEYFAMNFGVYCKRKFNRLCLISATCLKEMRIFVENSCRYD